MLAAMRRMRAVHIDALVAVAVLQIACAHAACAADPLEGPPLQLHDATPPASASMPDPHLAIDPTLYERRIHWWRRDALPYEVRQRALHPNSHLIGFEDSNWVVEPVPLTTRAMNDFRITGDPRSWMLLSACYRILF